MASSIGRYGNPAISSYVIDADGYYVATNVEVALQEIYEALTTNTPAWDLYVNTLRTAGDIQIDGNDILDSSGAVVISFDGLGEIDQLGSGAPAWADILYYNGSIWVNEDILPKMKQPIGFPNRTDSVISFTDGTRTLRIAPAATTFDYYILGKRYTVSAPDTVVIDPTEGLWFIHYDGAALTATQTVWDFSAAVVAYVALVHWDNTNNVGIIFGDERHESTVNPAWHGWSHETIGTRYASGFAVTEEAGGARIALDAGSVHDEDIEIAVINGTTGDAQWEQTLGNGITTWAEIPVFYRLGASGVYRRYATTDEPFYDNTGGDRIHWNEFAGGVWASNPAAANNRYVAYFIYATNNILEPIISIMGQDDSRTTLPDARDALGPENLNLGTLPTLEMKLLWRLIYRSNGAGATLLVDTTDYRAVSPVAPGTGLGTSHGALAGLSSDDHTQYLLDTGSRNPLSGTILDIGYTAATVLAGATKGIHVDLDTNVTLNNQDLTGLKITMPAAYGAGTEYAGYFAGDGRTVSLCNDTYAIQASGDVDVTGNIIVSGNVDGVDVSAHQTSLADHTDLTATAAQIEALQMFGSANAAWVPCAMVGAGTFTSISSVLGQISNVGAADTNIDFMLPIPCLKGGLKLHIKNLKFAVILGDADDYVDLVTIRGVNGIIRTTIDSDVTNHTSAGDKTFSGATMPASALDVGVYQSIYIRFINKFTGAGQYLLTNVRMECYYDP